ncbi:type II toxin-antitoxin system HicA family toxin [Leptotrichia hofstadii]|jgi:conserved domain protein|uniref:YcfA-like protein n=1 Tax=Leptotrichia hofstadii F0254 TaxID=634994 RepID=C9MVR6_9FUSO|nr:type II toxin-antitoxin system HicA family toxin [Leptotrichia hofstadii]EEX75488.1 YcfA-like protein [Leptotrichia hofstadii F0254]
MSRTKPYRSIVKVLKKNGWVLDHTTGSHEIYIKDGKICPVKCTKKDIPSGTLTNIEHITGLKF